MLLAAFSEIFFLQILLIMVTVPLTCYLARMSFKTYLSWFFHPTIFIVLSTLTFLVSYSSNVASLWMPLPFFKGFIGVSLESLKPAGIILMRVYSSLVATYFVVLTVPFAQMFQFFKKIHIPSFLLELIALMYRFIFLVLHEFLVIRDTLDLKFAFRQKRKIYRAWGMLANTLFIKLLDDNNKLNEVLNLKFGLEQEGR